MGGLTVKEQFWMAERLGINVNPNNIDDAANLFVEKMRLMLGSQLEVGGEKLTYDQLAREMVIAGMGKGLVGEEAAESVESQASYVAAALYRMFMVDWGNSTLRGNG